jgi:hypothetical protein
MAVSVTHAFVSPVADQGNPNEVGPNEWNDAHTIVGLGTAAEADSTDFATAAQGALADSAVQPGDVDALVSANADVAANTAARHAAVTVTDSAEINFTLTGQDITASLIAGSIDESKLDASVNASLDLADSAVQPAAIANMLETADIGVSVQAYDADLDSWAGVTRAAGFDTFVATPSSANLRAVLTDETGTGEAVFATSPTLVTPEIGAAHGTQLTIDAATNITAYGLDIDKQFSGTLAGSVNGHLVRAAADVATITGANFLNMVTLEHRIGGAGFQGGRQTLQVALIQEGASDAGSSNRNYVAVTPYTQATVSDGGTGTAWSTAKGGFFAMNPTTIAHAAATNLLDVTAGEVNVSMRAGSSAYKKTILSLVGMSDDAVSGSVVDAVLDMRNMTGAIGFNNALLFHDMGGNAQFPIKTTGTLLKATVNGATTIGAGVDISALTISGNAWASPSVTITGAGVVTAPSIGVDANFRSTIASSNPTTTFDSTDYIEYVRSSNNYNLYIGGTRQLNVNASAVDTPIGYAVAASYVVRSRKTGWSVDTGTAKRTANATYSATANASYNQAQIQALMDALRDATQTIKALKDDLHATAGHGLIGT